MTDIAPWDPPNKRGTCALCHSGPLLNTANQFTTAASDGTVQVSVYLQFGVPTTDSNILLTQQDIDDIIAFLRLF